MSRSLVVGVLGSFLGCLMALCLGATPATAQTGSEGTVVVVVQDQSGGIVQGADLSLRDLGTNDIRNGTSQEGGAYSFVGLSVGTYKLTVSKAGFETQVFESVTVQAARVTDLNVTLKVGATTVKVEVTESAVPLVETSSNAIGATIDLKQIEQLPLGGRDVNQLSTLIAGYNGTWNGLPSIAEGNNIDGVIASSSRMKFNGNPAPAVSVRIEDIQEMTIQTDQLDSNQGFGAAAMQINYVTRRGSNSFHGRAYEDFRNDYLNANSWYNNASGQPRGRLKLNDFGASLGGRIIKNKLFFFGSYAERKSPGTDFPTASILSPDAQKGIFTYVGSDSQNHTVCLFTNSACSGLGLINQYNTANGTSLPAGVNGVIQSQLSTISTKYVPKGTVTTNPSDPSVQTLNWSVANPSVNYYPSVRVDYNMSQNFRLNFAWNMTKIAPTFYADGYFPGAPTAATQTKNYTAAFGFDWTIRPTLVNQFRGGFFYNWTTYANSQGYADAPSVFYALGTSPQQYYMGSGSYYPLLNASDTMTWQHGTHTLSYGFSFYREQDHYYNPPGGVYGIQLGLASGDPALEALTLSSLPNGTNDNLTELQNLYSTLAGRISQAGSDVGGFPGNAVNLKTGQYNLPGDVKTYNLDELSKAWGLFIQDSWRFRPNLTVNLALRWDFTGDNHDLTGAYHGITSIADVYGPSGIGNLFSPGTLNGNPQGGTIAAQEHQYKPWNVSPQPQIGIAWTPRHSEGFTGKLLGSNTVVRAAFGIKRFTEPYQYFWNSAADFGAFFFQKFDLYPNTAAGTGYFYPGSLALGPAAKVQGFGDVPSGQVFSFVPDTYLKSATQAQFEFMPGAPGLTGIDPNVKQPYVQEWNLGIQREIGRNNVLEVSYHGNRSVHQWINMNMNEVNIFENGFLNQFKQAQQNMNINAAHGYVDSTGAPTTFANLGYTGQAATPIFDAAFAGEATGVAGALTDYGYPGFLTNLQQGQAGALAYALTNTYGGQGNANYFCNMVGASFSPCGVNLGYTPVAGEGANGAGYPINFFQVNPFFTGSVWPWSYGLLESGGYSTYNALQVDFRQKQWHGMQVDVNYTWSHTLGLSTPNDWTGTYNQLTLRNLRESYAPTLYDYRHVVHGNGTYDLPFGKGKRYLNYGGLADRVVGGWTIGTIFYVQSGAPFPLTGGYLTFNDYASGGIALNGITRSQLQNAVGVYRVSATDNGGNAATYVTIINPNLLAHSTGGLTNKGTSNALAFPNMSPGTLIRPIYLQGPWSWNTDLAISKSIPIRENIRFSLQGEFLNAFNHPNFTNAPNANVLSSQFGQVTGPGGFGRQIELRANLEF